MIASRSVSPLAFLLTQALLVFFLETPTELFAQTIRSYTVAPVETDPAIDDWTEDHYVFLGDGVARRNQLLVFLPGSFAQPRLYQLVLRESAAMGYHAIGLRYPNRWTVGGICALSIDPDCHENVRLETIDGGDRTQRIEVNRTNSIENRLIRLLELLELQMPGDGWGQYLDSTTEPVWARIVMAGHSQGGGHSALFGRDRRLARVVLFASPADYSVLYDRVAPWLLDNAATPIDRFFGFTHVQDDWERHLETWAALGLAQFGEPVAVDAQSPPYGGSHQLSTAAEPALAGAFHSSVVADAAVPRRADSSPAFDQVWRHLLGETTPPPLLLNQSRFSVVTRWTTPPGATGLGQPVPLTEDTGLFWFFQPNNLEVLVKVLDGCAANGNFWVFAGGLTNVEVELEIIDQETGASRIYRNPPSTAFAPIQDTRAFRCLPGG